jgi:hypothetical protein
MGENYDWVAPGSTGVKIVQMKYGAKYPDECLDICTYVDDGKDVVEVTIHGNTYTFIEDDIPYDCILALNAQAHTLFMYLNNREYFREQTYRITMKSRYPYNLVY